MEKTRNFFEAAGRPRAASFPRCKPRPSVVKYPRSRPRAGNAREPRAPLSRAKRAASPAARAVTDPGAPPSLRSLGQSPTARPRYPAQTKVKTRSAFRSSPSGEVRRARRPSELQSYRPALLGGRGVCAQGANIPYAVRRPASRRRSRRTAQLPGGKDRRSRAFPTIALAF